MRTPDPRVLLAGAVLAGGMLAPRLQRPRVTAIDSLCRPVRDLAEAATFYCAALGFIPIDATPHGGGDFARLHGIPDLTAQSLTLRLGRSQLRLIQYRPAGRTIEAPGADDAAFQHVAIVVADIRAAWAHINAIAAVVPISIGGPQRLPGGLWAMKFRDPDGHPLELLQFPHGMGRATWHTGTALFRGIDHSAITVGNTAASQRMYRDTLGLHVTSRGLNQGAPQQALDNVANPLVRVTQLRPGSSDGMRLELLDYLAPARPRPPALTAVNDLAADMLVLRVRDIAALLHRLARAGASFVSPGLVPFDGGPAMLLRDPDGHHLLCIG